MSAASSFGQFLADLVSDSTKIQQYLRNPTGYATAAGLSAEEKDVLESNEFRIILDYAIVEGDRPVGSGEEGGSG